MSDFSEQKVVVICDFSERMKDVIVHGARMADILRKELCLLAIWKDKKEKIKVQEKMLHTIRSLKANLPSMQISSLIFEDSIRYHMGKLVNEYNAVLIVLHQAGVKYGLKALRESSIPFLFVNGFTPEYLQYKQVLIPVDFRKASKETSLWASYYGRFNKSKIHVIYAHETNADQSLRLKRNADFFARFLSSMHVNHHLIPGKSSSWGICNEALVKSKELNGDVLIFSASSSISLIDLMIGLPEKKIIQKAGELPVMLINPSKDICVLCD